MVPDSPQVVTKLRTYDRSKQAEYGRKGGLAKAANARRREPLLLTGDEAKALLDAYRLLTKIAERHKVKLDQYPLDGQPSEPTPESTDQDAA